LKQAGFGDGVSAPWIKRGQTPKSPIPAPSRPDLAGKIAGIFPIPIGPGHYQHGLKSSQGSPRKPITGTAIYATLAADKNETACSLVSGESTSFSKHAHLLTPITPAFAQERADTPFRGGTFPHASSSRLSHQPAGAAVQAPAAQRTFCLSAVLE